jgi:hypothetical protein
MEKIKTQLSTATHIHIHHGETGSRAGAESMSRAGITGARELPPGGRRSSDWIRCRVALLPCKLCFSWARCSAG